MFFNQIWSLEAELNILSEELKVSTELLLFPKNYPQKVLDYISLVLDYGDGKVSFEPEDLSLSIQTSFF